MSIEKFIPGGLATGHKHSLLDKFRGVLAKMEILPVYKEFYNSDKTRKYIFHEQQGENGFRQLNVKLWFKIADSWSEAMTVMTRWSDGQEQLYGLEIDALTKEKNDWPFSMYWYDRNTGGLKRWSGVKTGIMEFTPSETRVMAESLGFIREENLPSFVDFEKTAREFLIQAKDLDFSYPVLYPRELLK
jgi:hypothetical protein